MTTRENHLGSDMVVVRPEKEIPSLQHLPYFVGVSATSAGATKLSMNLVVIPAQSAAEPHFHRGFESAVYMIKGDVEVRYGSDLQEHLTVEEGDFLFIPADIPHQPVNHGNEPALAVVARNDANEQESVELFTQIHYSNVLSSGGNDGDTRNLLSLSRCDKYLDCQRSYDAGRSIH